MATLGLVPIVGEDVTLEWLLAIGFPFAIAAMAVGAVSGASCA